MLVAKTIAHWVKLKRQQLDDVPALAVITQARLVYGVLRRVENQIVAGDGVGENLVGLLNSETPIGSIPFVADTFLADLTLDGITEVLAAEADPNAVVMNPYDRAAMLKAKAGALDGSWTGPYLSMGPFASSGGTIWDLPWIPLTVMPRGTAIVGDFTQGCTLFVREAPNIRISYADSDDFIRNRCTMLGEGRFGPAIWRPACFAKVALSA